MAHPLNGAHFKIVWAHQHLDALKKHVRSYLDQKPYLPLFHHHPDGRVEVTPPQITLPPHLDIGGVAGDCLHAAMSILDYIVWELASRHAGRPLVPPPHDPKDKPSFPLYVDPDGYKKWVTRMKPYHIPATSLSEIEAVQPYHAGYEPLAVLFLLVNQDKHRLPLLAKGYMPPGDFDIRVGGVSVVAQSTAISVALDTELLSRLSPTLREGQHKMEVHTQSVPFVAFGDLPMPWEPIEVTLEKILKCVERVFARSHSFFV